MSGGVGGFGRGRRCDCRFDQQRLTFVFFGHEKATKGGLEESKETNDEPVPNLEFLRSDQMPRLAVPRCESLIPDSPATSDSEVTSVHRDHARRTT